MYATTNQRPNVLVREQRGAIARVTPAGEVFRQNFVAEMIPRTPVK